MGFHFSMGWGNNVRYRKDNGGNNIYTFSKNDLGKFISCFDSGYSEYNMLKLFESIPEVYAPVDLIADRVTKGIWELIKEDSGDVVTDNKQWNKLKAQPNWKQSFTQFIYNAVVYKYVTGNRYFYKYIPSVLTDKFENIQSLWLLPPQYTEAYLKINRPKYFYATNVQDFIDYYSITWGSQDQEINPEYVFHDAFLDVNVESCDILKGFSPLKAAKYPMSNLMAVYEARNVIYVKRGTLGIIVSKKGDASGLVSLTSNEKQSIRDAYNNDYGLTGGRDTIGITEAPVDYLRTGMSIQELMPFEETFASAAAIYSILNVPRAFIPSPPDKSVTYNNGFSDERKLYADVAIPEAENIATILTNLLGLSAIGLKIRVRFDHVEALQEDKKLQAETLQIKAQTYTSLYQNGLITKNDMLVSLNKNEIEGGDIYIADSNNTDPLAIKIDDKKLSVLQTILSDQNINTESKKNTLMIVFGLSEEEASKMTMEDQPTQNMPINNLPIGNSIIDNTQQNTINDGTQNT